jgi:hypothetical protein
MGEASHPGKRKIGKRASPVGDDAISHEIINQAIRKRINKSSRWKHPLGLLYAFVVFLIGVVALVFAQSLSNGANQCGWDGILSGCAFDVVLKGTKPSPPEPPFAPPSSMPVTIAQPQKLPPIASASASNQGHSHVPTPAVPAPVPLLPKAVALAPATPVSGQPPPKTYIVNNNTTMLATPEPFGNPVESLSVGDAVQATANDQQDPAWIHVETADGQSGYVDAKELIGQ